MSKPEITKEVLEETGQELVDLLAKRDFVANSDAPFTGTIKMSDGTFRKKTIEPQWDFVFSYAYVGSRGTLIFGLESTDWPTPNWSSLEVSPQDIDKYFPSVLIELERAGIIFGGQSMQSMINHLANKKIVAEKLSEQDEMERLRSLPTFGMF